MSGSSAVLDIPNFLLQLLSAIQEQQPFVLFQSEESCDLLRKDFFQAREQMLALPVLSLSQPISFYTPALCLSTAAGCNQSHGWS